MKRIVLQLRWVILFLSVNMLAQTYTCVKSSGTYTEITGTELSSDGFDQDNLYPLTLPFDIEVFGTTYSSVVVQARTLAFDLMGEKDWLYPFDGILEDNASNTSSISYVTEGSSPNRILKVQMKDIALGLDNTGNDFVNYQVWLYETSNLIEFHYGPGSVADPAIAFDSDEGATIGVQKNYFTYFLLTGEYDDDASSGAGVHYTGIPDNGTFYTFTPAPGGNSYSFSQSTATYTEITGTEISTDNFDDESIFPVSFPFDFLAYGTSYSGGAAGTGGILFDAVNEQDFANACGGPLADNTTNTASISYATEGNAPNRIFKLQNKDLAFYTDNTNADYVNVQIWLYETTNVIEFHYGPSSVVNADSYNGDDGPIVGLVHSGNDFFFLEGNANSPTQGLGPVTGTPPDGMVYIFTPTFTTNIFAATTNSDKIQLFPNPGNGIFYLSSEALNSNASVTVLNTLGTTVFSSSWNGNTKQFTSNLESGVYTVKVDSDGKSYFKKLVVE